MHPVGKALAWAAVAMSVTACVTINIYFPAAAAEKAADRIIDEVWQMREGASTNVKPSNGEGK